MIENFKTESKRYSLLHMKNKGDIEDLNKNKQIEKIKNVFKDNDVDGKNKQENEIINQQIFNLNFNSKNIEPFSNFSLIKNSIENEKFDQIYQNKKEKFSPSKKTNHLNNNDIIVDNSNNYVGEENSRNKDMISNEIKKDLNKNNFNEDILNVTQDQMKIFDDEVNKLYNSHKKNIQLKIFQINHPYLHNIKFINNNIEKISSLMNKEERIFPILKKQKSILKKIQENNMSRSNSSLDKNTNDSMENSMTNKNIKSNRLNFRKSSIKNKLDLFHPHTRKNNNNSLDNYSSSENIKNNLSEKMNLKQRKHINFKPFTLQQYKNKYENNNNIKILLGGLGANLGGEEWNKKKKILERKKQYSEYIKNDNEFIILNKKKIKLKNYKNEEVKTITSKKDSEFSNDSNNCYKHKIFKTENNIINHKKIQLPLINQRFNSNSKIKLKRKSDYNSINKMNQENDFEGSEKDLKQLIKQYEEYNEKLKL